MSQRLDLSKVSRNENYGGGERSAVAQRSVTARNTPPQRHRDARGVQSPAESHKLLRNEKLNEHSGFTGAPRHYSGKCAGPYQENGGASNN